MNAFKYLLKIAIPILFWINESSADSPKVSDTMIKMKAVKDRILNGYDKTIRPTEEGSNTTEIHWGLIPRQIMEVDEDRALLIMDSYVFMSWTDPRLVWNSSTEYDGDLPLPPNLLWLPDLTVFNSHSLHINPTQDVPLLLWSSGLILWFPPVFTQTSCPGLNAALYPNEIVTCMVRFGSWTYDGWEIDFSHEEELYVDEFLNINPRWELIISETKLIKNITTYEGYGAPFISIDAVFPLRRRMPPEIEATRIPCILIMVLTLLIFWMPTNSSKKVLQGGFLFLSLMIMFVYVAWSTKFPLGVISAVSFLQSAMYIVVSTLLLQVLVIFNICSISGAVRPPSIIMQIITGSFGKYTCLKSSVSNKIPIDDRHFKETSPTTFGSPSPKDDWMLFAAALDRLFFILMLIVALAIHHL